MNISKEHEEVNSDDSLDKSEKQTNTAPAAGESTLSDLLHVLGVKKKKSGTKDLHSVSQTPEDPPVFEEDRKSVV